LLLYKYCFLSALYEYILCSGEVDLLRADIQEHKENRRAKKSANKNESNLLAADLTNLNEEIAEIDSELVEYRIQMDNPEALKNRVCKLLLAFLNIEETNKKSTDFSYEEILKRVGRSKEKEKQGIIKKLKKLSIEARSVEDLLKNYRLEHWNVGQQKGLFQYDKETYNRERDELLKGLDEETRGAGMLDNVNEELLDIYQLNALDENNQNAEDAGVGRDDYDFTDMGAGFMDGDYYGDEAEDDFPED
jgi:hypothetical protein